LSDSVGARAGRVALLLAVCGGPLLADRPPCAFDGAEPSVVLAIDGVPYSVVEQARRDGAFRGWPEARPLIATFPSMTNVSFAAIFAPLGVEPIAGYEIPHFDHDAKRMVGRSPLGAKAHAYGWRALVDKEVPGIWDHLVVYTAPRRRALNELAEVERKIWSGARGVHVVYVAATDSLTHFRGHDGILRYLRELARRLEVLQERYQKLHGRCLRLVLLSDHGNTERKVQRIGGLRSLLREAGFELGTRLRYPNDVVAPTFGLCNYGALYVQEGRAEEAARTVAAHPQVELAAFLSAEDRVTVVSRGGTAELTWRSSDEGWWYRYRPGATDPLGLSDAVSRLRRRGSLDGEGYALQRDWLFETVGETYPNAPQRIVDAFTGVHVRHTASVLFSIAQGYAWGRRAGYLGAAFKGGRLEGTHGGLDAESSLGFLLVNDPALDPGRAVSAAGALSFLKRGRVAFSASGE